MLRQHTPQEVENLVRGNMKTEATETVYIFNHITTTPMLSLDPRSSARFVRYLAMFCFRDCITARTMSRSFECSAAHLSMFTSAAGKATTSNGVGKIQGIQTTK